MILQNTNSRFNLFLIASFDSWVCWLGEPRKKICWLSQQGTEKSIFRVIFPISFYVITTMILQNTNFRFNLFRIESFDSRVCCLGEPRKKICWLSQQRTEKSIFRVIFRIGFDVINAMILQNTISRFTLLKFSLYLSFQVFSMCIELYVCIMLSLASLVPISSHINNSPLSSTYGDMTLLYSLSFK